MKDLKNKVAVVTGGASGIGLAMPKRFAAEGMKVAIADIEAEALAKAEGELATLGADVMSVKIDVADAAQVASLAGEVRDRFGAAHVLCNNAGVGLGRGVLDSSLADWEWVLGVNLMGVVHGLREFVPRMIELGEPCHVVNTASMAGLISVPRLAAYNVSKHGVVTLSESLHAELRMKDAKVGVSVLCPGVVATNIPDSDRNRPDALADDVSDADDAAKRVDRMQRAGARRAIAGGQSPDKIAMDVLNAIKQDTFYIITHPELLEVVERRMSGILEGKFAEPPRGF